MDEKMAWLLRKRKNVINNFMNQAVSYIVKYCLANKVGNVVIDRLKEIKNGINLVRITTRTSTTFHSDCLNTSSSQSANTMG